MCDYDPDYEGPERHSAAEKRDGPCAHCGQRWQDNPDRDDLCCVCRNGA